LQKNKVPHILTVSTPLIFWIFEDAHNNMLWSATLRRKQVTIMFLHFNNATFDGIFGFTSTELIIYLAQCASNMVEIVR